GFQPSDLAKLALILALAVMLHERAIRGLLDYIKGGAIVLPPVALVFDEPDLGSALVLVALAAGIVLIRGVPWRHLVLIVLAVTVAVPTVVWPNLADHQKVRLVSFLDPAPTRKAAATRSSSPRSPSARADCSARGTGRARSHSSASCRTVRPTSYS